MQGQVTMLPWKSLVRVLSWSCALR